MGPNADVRESGLRRSAAARAMNCMVRGLVVARQPTVYIVDDDLQVRESLELFVRSVGLNVETFASAEDFLDRYVDSPGPPRCLVVDVRMPGLSGLGLQEKLASEGIQIPMIIITGYGNVPMAVQAMRAGAVYFLEKPVNRQVLFERVQEAIDRDAVARQDQARQKNVAKRLDALSPREREVLDLLVVGKNAKQIASRMNISEKTVAKHRAKVFEKMRVDSIAELVQLSWFFRDSSQAGAGVSGE
jgi:two-component system response regulator FixJ